MRNVILLGRGVEGCGVTKAALEFAKQVPCEIYATKDKVWGRRKSHGDLEVVEFTFDQTDSIIDRMRGADRLFVFSMPSIEHPQECQDGVLRIVQSFSGRKALIHLDHSVRSLHNNAHLTEFVKSADVVLAHSSGGALATYIEKNDLSTSVHEIANVFDWDEHRSLYWRPIEEQDDWGIRWIGRTARWKGVKDILDFHDSHTRASGYRLMMEGLEASINWVIACYYDDHGRTQRRDVNLKFRAWPGLKKDKDIRHGSEQRGDAAYLYPPYSNHECMQRLARTAFGSNLYNLPKTQYGNIFEYCHGEVVASGAVPIFHKHWGDNIVHRVTGKPATHHGDSGTVWLGKENRDECAETLRRLSEDRVMRDEWREMAFSFWKSHAPPLETAQHYLDVLDKSTRKNSIEEFFS